MSSIVDSVRVLIFGLMKKILILNIKQARYNKRGNLIYGVVRKRA